MSSTNDDLLVCMRFKLDILNECGYAKTDFIQWISDDEFLLIFDKFCFVYRLTPFYMAASLTDKFPVSLSRIEIDSQASPTILRHCLNLLKHSEVDVNFARAGLDATLWKDVNETVADPIFLQPSFLLGSGSIVGNSGDTDPSISISQVVLAPVGESQRINSTGSLIVILLADGRAYATSKIDRGKYEIIHLTPLLYDYVNENAFLFRSIVPDLIDIPPPAEEATSLQGLKNIRRLGCFLSTKHWLATDLRFTDESQDVCGISLQRSGHLILWRCITKVDALNFRIIANSAVLTNYATSAAIVLSVDQSRCLLLLGTTNGDIISLPINLTDDGDCSIENEFQVLLHEDDGLCVSMMRLFQLDDTRHLLIASRQFFVIAAVLDISSTGDLNLISSTIQRTPCRFAITDVVPFENYYYVVSSDRVVKYEISVDGGIINLRLITGSVIALNNEKIAGLSFSRNRVLQVYALMKKFLDRYAKNPPLTLYVRMLLEPTQLWNTLMDQGNLKEASDYLILLRSFILHQEQSKVIGDLLIRELESLDEDDTHNTSVLLKLRVFRFATSVFSGKKSKAEDLEFWNRVSEKVERLLVVRLANTILERARSLDRVRPAELIMREVVASILGYLGAEGVQVSGEFGDLVRPRCPLCDAESFQSASISEHVCVNNHRYPSCALTFLPIQSFNYRKCSRCDLAFLDREKSLELVEIIPEIDYCPFCDGQIISP